MADDDIDISKPTLVGKEVTVVKDKPKQTHFTNFNKNLITGISTGNVDINQLENFYNKARSREAEYSLYDQMGQDPTIGSVVATYVEDIIRTNSEGKRIVVSCNDPELQKMAQNIIDRTELENKVEQIAHNLVMFGDAFVRLYRKSDIEKADSYFTSDENNEKESGKLNEYLEHKKEEIYSSDKQKEKLKEDVGVVLRSQDDQYAYVVDVVKNPNEVFDLVSFGKTVGYVYVPSQKQLYTDMGTYNNNIAYANYLLNTYNPPQTNVSYVFNDDEFVHGCLYEPRTRVVETIKLFVENEEQRAERVKRIANGEESEKEAELNEAELDILGTYTTRKGTSLLVDCYLPWRQLSLLENSLLLSRLSLSGILRIFSTEVGDLSDEEAEDVLDNVKDAVENRLAVSVGEQIQEYQSPSAMINSVFTLTREGNGAISCSTIGTDYDPKNICDVEFFRDKLFGALRVPKQYFGWTDDSTGFNGGTALSLIDARYGQAVKKYQAIIAQMVTDIINYYFIDSGNSPWINKFQIKLTPPPMEGDNTAETSRQEQIRSEISNTSDLLNLIGGAENDAFQLKLIKAQLPPDAINSEALEILNKQIEKIEKEGGNREEQNPEGKERGIPPMGRGIGGGTSEFSPEPPSISGEEPEEPEFGGGELENGTSTETETETETTSTEEEEPSLNQPGVNWI